MRSRTPRDGRAESRLAQRLYQIIECLSLEGTHRELVVRRHQAHGGHPLDAVGAQDTEAVRGQASECRERSGPVQRRKGAHRPRARPRHSPTTAISGYAANSWRIPRRARARRRRSVHGCQARPLPPVRDKECEWSRRRLPPASRSAPGSHGHHTKARSRSRVLVRPTPSRRGPVVRTGAIVGHREHESISLAPRFDREIWRHRSSARRVARSFPPEAGV